MNRRGFFASMLKAGVAFTILPPATTYTRLWKAVAVPQINPAWLTATHDVVFDSTLYTGVWRFVQVGPGRLPFPED